MAQPVLDATRYLQHAGRQCPVCFQEGVSRNDAAIHAHVVHGIRLILVPCCCSRCAATWVETYRLVGVHANVEEALATAEKTYQGSTGVSTDDSTGCS
jgi:hypothetical protein